MPKFDYTSPDLWCQLRQRAADLVTAYLSVCEQPGKAGPDAAWRTLMRDIRDAVADSMDGDPVAAVGALEEALLDGDEQRGILRRSCP